MSFDNQHVSDEQLNKLLNNYKILQWAIVDMIQTSTIPLDIRQRCVEALDKTGFFDGLRGGEELREEWNKP